LFSEKRSLFLESFDGGVIRYGIVGLDWGGSQANSMAKNFVVGYP